MKVYDAARPLFIGPLPKGTRMQGVAALVPRAYMYHIFPIASFAGQGDHLRNAEFKACVKAFVERFDAIVETLAEGDFESFEAIPPELIDGFVPEMPEGKSGNKGT